MKMKFNPFNENGYLKRILGDKLFCSFKKIFDFCGEADPDKFLNQNFEWTTVSSGEWGDINGTLENQTDLQNALNNRWGLAGNAETNPSVNFIGTTDDKDLVFRTNNIEKLRITQFGRLLNDGAIPTNTIIGNTVGNESMTGAFNSVLGSGNTFSANTTGVFNTAIGWGVLPLNTTGNLNVGVGGASLFVNTTGAWNTAVGVDALKANTTGNYNVSFGYRSGRFNTVGSNNISIGWDASVPSGTLDGQMNLGNIIYAFGRGGVGVGSVVIGGTVNAGFKLDVNGTVRVQNSLTLGNLASDPAGANGMIYYNTTTNKFRGFENGAWVDLI